MATDSAFADIVKLGSTYIDAVFPLMAGMAHNRAPLPIVPPVSAALDWLVTVLAAFAIPADGALPFWLVFELNGVAILTGHDRLMGVLPLDWFDRFTIDKLTEVSGLSLGEWAPHAVIFLGRSGDGSDARPAMTLPAHELGQTYGLSTDSRLRTSWTCKIDWGPFVNIFRVAPPAALMNIRVVTLFENSVIRRADTGPAKGRNLNRFSH